MPADRAREVGQRIAATRHSRRMTQQDLARASFVSLAMVKAIERGARMPSDSSLDALADSLGVDPSALRTGYARTEHRVHRALPAISAALAAYDAPEGPPVRTLPELRAAMDEAVNWRLGAQYGRISQVIPGLLEDSLRALHVERGAQERRAAALVVSAARTADALAFKFGAHDLSARLVDLMRWASLQAEEPLLAASVAYVRTETFFVARAHGAGLRALEAAIDASPAPDRGSARAARGSLHMRAAVIAGRAGDPEAADSHLDEALRLADQLREDVYDGTAFGPDSVRVHEVSVAVSLGGDHVERALSAARDWTPPSGMPAERRSGFSIELARAQLWVGRMDDAFESLKVARRIAPQHTREHPWARETAATLRRLKRADAESLTHYAEWIGAIEQPIRGI
ncbi:helix-turn-helix domain-containing protein [Streptomyces sp. NPDC059994]|uniref:helix-turn-helix domain-containing protein n=1 Tax=Streptomyces sp. NPDC059994 TaxID=3347029 RepID=UPI0036C40853